MAKPLSLKQFLRVRIPSVAPKIMMNNNKKTKIDTFTGTIDALLKHTAKMDVSDFYTDEDVPMSEEDAIKYIMEKCNISDKKEAKMLYEQMKLDEVTETVKNLVNDVWAQLSISVHIPPTDPASSGIIN